MANNLEQKILAGFAKEVELYLPAIRESLQTFGIDPTPFHTLEAAYRSLHTIHGAAVMMGLAVLSHITAYLEAALLEFLHAQRALDEAWSTWLRCAVDTLDRYIHGMLADEHGEAQVIAEVVLPFRRLKGLPEVEDATAIAAVLGGQPAPLETVVPIRLRTEDMVRDGLGLPDEWAMPPAAAVPLLPDPLAVPLTEPEAAPVVVSEQLAEPQNEWDAEVLAGEGALPIVVANDMAAAFPEALSPEEALSAEAGSLDDLLTMIEQELAQTYGPPRLTATASPAISSLTERYVLFTLAGTRYAIAIATVLEIGRVPAITYVPNVPPWIRGVTNLRGEILSVIDFRLFLGLTAPASLDHSRLLVVQALEQELTTALIVDQVNGMLHLSAPRPAGPEVAVSDKLAPYLRGVYDQHSQFLAVFDLERWLASPDVRQFE